MDNFTDGIQDFFKEAGESACYAFCLASVARDFNRKFNKDKTFNLLTELVKACSDTSRHSIIYYNKNNLLDDNNFYVQNPALFLEQLTGRKWTVNKELNTQYYCSVNEYKINRYEREKTGIFISHFDRDNFHPVADSQTVKYGKIKDVRICKVM